VKLVAKTREGGHLKRTYHTAQTPYQRVMESPLVDTTTKAHLRAQYLTLNPAALKRQIERELFVLRSTIRPQRKTKRSSSLG
jgi:hypothetical protein